MFGKFDITYCTNTECPIKDCKRHWKKLRELQKENNNEKVFVSMADFSGICRDYIVYLVDKLENNKC